MHLLIKATASLETVASQVYSRPVHVAHADLHVRVLASTHTNTRPATDVDTYELDTSLLCP